MKNVKNWHNIDWKLINIYIKKIQEKIVMEYKNNNIKRVYELQRQLVVSFEARALAIRIVYTINGGKIPGIDGKVLNSPEERYKAIIELGNIIKNIKNYKVSPLKIINIENAINNKEIGISTIMDRAIQCLYYLGVDPIIETRSDEDSYGFRKYRSTIDAISRLRTLLDKKHSPEWIFEIYIEKCLDNNNLQDYIIKKIPICDKNVIYQWLKFGITDFNYLYTTKNIYQNNIISPMICNAILNGIEKEIKDATYINKKIYSKVHLIRYINEIIITADNKEIIEEIIRPSIKIFLKERGLKLNESKTKITNIWEGFNFLNWNIRKHHRDLDKNKGKKREDILIIKPSKESRSNLIKMLKPLYKKYKKLDVLIGKINPILKGWSEYFRSSSHSIPYFCAFNGYVFRQTWNWLRKTFKGLSVVNIKRKYIMSLNRYNWVIHFNNKSLFQIASVKTFKAPLLKFNINPYTEEGRNYFENKRNNTILTKSKAKLYKLYNWRCSVCNESLFNGESIEIHHIIPKNKGGNNTYKNLMPLHTICHQKVTHYK